MFWGDKYSTNYTYGFKPTIPHKCPVCNGSGIYVENGSYSAQIPTRFSNPCHACNGTGVLWS